jgi:arylsulfatase A-like enzyme
VRPAWRDSAGAGSASAHPDPPNVLYIVWDDVGIAGWDAFGGLIETPNMSRLAARGLRYTQWHTPALSASTRSCLLTGHESDATGVAGSGQGSEDWRGQGMVIPPETATLAEILAGNGYRTYCVGKWHLSPAEAAGRAGSRLAWPLERGFDHYYGFLGGQTSDWYPDLVYDNRYVDPPYSPADGYHLSRDLADMAIEFIHEGVRAGPGRAWLCCLSFGPNDAPHAAPREWADKYRGRFEMGYDRYRDIVLGSMKRLGTVPGNVALAPAGQHSVTAAQGAVSTPRPWRSLTREQRELCNSEAESYASLCSCIDYQVGRLVDYLEESGQLDDTIVVVCSANATGADRDSDPSGWAWAFRTPYNVLRQRSHGGTAPSPLIISWPRQLADVAGGVRDQYHHAVDLVPTILGCAAIGRPQLVKGHRQAPMDGVSMRYTFTAADPPSTRLIQRYEVPSGRAIYADGWKAIAADHATAARTDREPGAWELYHVAADWTEIDDVTAAYPAKTAELASLWAATARHPPAMLVGPGRFTSARRQGPQVALGRRQRAAPPGSPGTPGRSAPP